MRRSLFGLLLALAACSDSSDPISIVHGAYAVAVSGDALSITLTRDGAPLVELGRDAFELGIVSRLDDTASYDPYWLEPEGDTIAPDPPPDLRFQKLATAKASKLSDTAIAVDQTYDGMITARLEISAAGDASDRGARFALKLVPVSAPAVAYMRMRPTVTLDEAFYGLGDASDEVNHRGKRRAMQIEADLGIESANNEMHVPIPLIIGTRGWGLFVESVRAGVFDVAKKDPARVEITYGTAADSGAGLAFHLFGAPHPLDVTKQYYEVTGYPLLPATWAYGPWIWRDENRDQAEVEDDIAKIRSLDLATSAIWIDRPYTTFVGETGWTADDYPDAARMIRRAHDMGLRMALWHVPYVEEAAGAHFEEARSRGFFPPETNLRLNPWGDPLDLTNPDAYAWWQGLVSTYTDMGVEGFKLDYAEDIVAGIAGGRTVWTFADGSDERTMHYGYTPLYHRLYAEKLPASGGFLLCRAGRWGGQKFASVIWPGDLDATLTKFKERFTPRDEANEIVGVGGLPASVAMGLNLGPSGYPFYGSDTGGYRHSPPDRETFTRWFQQTALSAVMQVGDSSSEPPWMYTAKNQRNDEVLALYRTYARLHLRLFPYVWSYAVKLAEDGRAIMRPFGLAFPEAGAHPADQYALGDELLVAPVMERGVVAREVVFPAGEWIDWWTGERIAGGQTKRVDAPLEKLPLYLRAGGIVPMLRPGIDTLSPVATSSAAEIESWANDRGVLWLRVADGPANAFVVHDGTRVTLSARELAIDAGSEYVSGVMIELVGASVTEVSIDGTALAKSASDPPAMSTWSSTTAAGGAVHVAVPAGSHRVTF